MICWIEDSPDVAANGLVRNIEKGEVNTVRLTSNTYGITYDSNISFTIYVIKKDKQCFTRNESMEINRWLTSSITPKMLYFNDDEIPSLHYYAVCTVVEDVAFNGHNAKKIVFETNSPFGFMTPAERIFLVEGEELFSIENMADTVDGLFYPTMKIEGDSTVSIENKTDHQSVCIDLSKHNFITIDCAHMRFIDDTTQKLIPLYHVGITDENLYWFRLLRGTNHIKVTGNCTITFIFEFPRKAGCL